MPNITEYGDIVFVTLDEWGKRKIDGLSEYGTKIIIIVDYIIATDMSNIDPITISCEDI